ncbi:hypothetical protein, partial [Bacteroides acidifaciens]|uniref:hypothetical protein n=1 Tax=Bacteroides acidifaciens TaxID=85831 RepID=UPI00248A910E
MSISEQVKELRNFGNNRKLDVFGYDEIHKIMSQSADTIESLSAKLQAANMERSAEDCGGWIYCGD